MTKQQLRKPTLIKERIVMLNEVKHLSVFSLNFSLRVVAGLCAQQDNGVRRS
jgi:hypothetical protein